MEKLGELLLAQGAITEDQLRSALADQEKRTIPLGTALVEAGAVAARQRGGTDLGAILLDEFMTRLGEESQVPKGSAA